MSSPEDIIIIIHFTTLVTLCLVFNAIVCVTFSCKRTPRRPVNLLMLNLTVSDLLLAVFILPRHVFKKLLDHPEGELGDILCKFVSGGGLFWVPLSASELLLTALAVERYLSVLHPLTFRGRSFRKIVGRLPGICWASAIVINLPSTCVQRYDEEKNFCLEDWPAWISPKAYVVCIFFVGASSVVAMCVLYTKIILTLWKKKRKATEISQIARLKARNRVTKTLLLVTVVHILCRTPNYTIYILTQYHVALVGYGSHVYEITVLLILLNSTLHPYLMYWQTQSFRQAIKEQLHQFCMHFLVD